MRRILKIGHIFGLTLFLGSIFGHIVAGALGGPPGAPGFLAAREEIETATRFLTLPGLALAMLTGAAMVQQTPAWLRQRWIWLHAGLAALVVASSVLLVIPAGGRALQMAQAGAAAQDVAATLLVEHVAGAVNIALAVAILAIGVVRPVLRRTGSGVKAKA
jgi:hypothetical protein